MGLIAGDPALVHLAALKLRGSLRRLWRRLKTPAGLFFIVVGTLLACAWLGSLVFGHAGSREAPADVETLRRWTALGILAFSAVVGFGALSIRGVYLPKNEIERLFAAPTTRANIVRYRLLLDSGRSFFGALVLALLCFRRMPVPVYGFLGTILAVLTLGVVRQMASILLADVHSRLGSFFEGRKFTPLRIVMAIVLWFIIMGLFVSGRVKDRLLAAVGLNLDVSEILEHPVLDVLLAPFTPWVRMMTAGDGEEFLGWGGLSLLVWAVFFEITARLRVDFREASIQTSSDIAVRLKRMGRGGIGQGAVPQFAAARRVPWLFGRGPGGAIAWIKTAAILRKSRGTLLLGLLIVSAITIGVSLLFKNTAGLAFKGDEGDVWIVLGHSSVIALLGVLYLSGVLRFDFRSDLDSMVQIKAWPVGPTATFVATLLPQALLISGALAAAILIRALVLGSFHPALFLLVLALPWIEFAWLAVDNAVFLCVPVRYLPGQDGSLHHAGRAIVLVLLRFSLAAVTLGLIFVPAFVIFSLGPETLGLSWAACAAMASAIGAAVMCAMVAFLAWRGGRMLRRLDVARDRG